MKASPAPTVSTTSTGRGRALVSPSAVKAVAPPAPRVSTTSWVRSPASRAAGDVVGVRRGVDQHGVLVAQLHQCAPGAELEHLAADAVAVVDERLAQVGVVADEHVAGAGLLDQVEHAVAPGLEQRAERADVQRPARRELLAGQAPLQVEVVAGSARRRRDGRWRPTYARSRWVRRRTRRRCWSRAAPPARRARRGRPG